MVEAKITNKYFTLHLIRNYRRLCAKGQVTDSRLDSPRTLAALIDDGREWGLELGRTAEVSRRYLCIGCYDAGFFCIDHQYTTVQEATRAFNIFKRLAFQAEKYLTDEEEAYEKSKDEGRLLFGSMFCSVSSYDNQYIAPYDAVEPDWDGENEPGISAEGQA